MTLEPRLPALLPSDLKTRPGKISRQARDYQRKDSTISEAGGLLRIRRVPKRPLPDKNPVPCGTVHRAKNRIWWLPLLCAVPVVNFLASLVFGIAIALLDLTF